MTFATVSQVQFFRNCANSIRILINIVQCVVAVTLHKENLFVSALTVRKKASVPLAHRQHKPRMRTYIHADSYIQKAGFFRRPALDAEVKCENGVRNMPGKRLSRFEAEILLHR